MPQLADFQEVCEQAARAAGAVLLDWAGRFAVREKGPADLVTEADLASQEIIRERILAAFPKHGFLAEENASIPSRDEGYRWIVDPLDGTTNYVHAIPNYCVSIALEQSGNLLVGVIYDPVSGECYSAAAGQGAFLSGRRLAVSRVTELGQAILGMSLPPNVGRDNPELADFIEFAAHAQSLRRMGSSALNLCYVAAGRYDAYWSASTKIWDIAAGILMVREAGGIVTSRSGGPFVLDPPHFMTAATSELHAQIQQLLRIDR